MARWMRRRSPCGGTKRALECTRSRRKCGSLCGNASRGRSSDWREELCMRGDMARYHSLKLLLLGNTLDYLLYGVPFALTPFTWHRMNCMKADVEDNTYLLIVVIREKSEKFVQLSDFIFCFCTFLANPPSVEPEVVGEMEISSMAFAYGSNTMKETNTEKF
ncbi:hypothetical protein Sjap_020319 [Stephania japonica]|uniref:Uncharacterized protein n=1 Tax=Stephania japonica TaxID=461633 RepID=A0AAP0I0C6_9MAGN